MRRAILLALCALTLSLVASVPSGAAPAAGPKVRSSAQWFPASRTLYVMASWTPAKYQTDVTAIVERRRQAHPDAAREALADRP